MRTRNNQLNRIMTRKEFITKYPEGEQLLKDFNFPPEDVIVTEVDTERFYSLVGFLIGRVEDLSRTSPSAEQCMVVLAKNGFKGRVVREDKLHDNNEVVGNRVTVLDTKNFK